MKHQKKQCKCINDYYFDCIQLYKANNQIHNYYINKESNTVYVDYDDQYCVFSLSTTDDKDYFYFYFLDLKEERKLKLQKLKKINETR